MYELLSPSVKSSFEKASQALHEQLYPVESEALVSAQLMKRKQLSSETVDEFAQDLEKLFERSYGCRQGMDESSTRVAEVRRVCTRTFVEMAKESPTIRLYIQRCSASGQSSGTTGAPAV